MTKTKVGIRKMTLFHSRLKSPDSRRYKLRGSNGVDCPCYCGLAVALNPAVLALVLVQTVLSPLVLCPAFLFLDAAILVVLFLSVLFPPVLFPAADARIAVCVLPFSFVLLPVVFVLPFFSVLLFFFVLPLFSYLLLLSGVRLAFFLPAFFHPTGVHRRLLP